jgi:isonocardicin synthase
MLMFETSPASEISGPLQTLTVRKDEKPYDVFVLDLGDRRIVGLKTPARVAPFPGAPLQKGCLIEPSMALGHLDRIETGAETYIVTYQPLSDTETAAAFQSIGPDTELLYPLRRLADGHETAQPPAYWDSRTADIDIFDTAEHIVRDVVADILDPHIRPNDLVYDPACSSGAFLGHLKLRYPAIRTLGQDRSAKMVEIARRRVDTVVLGDCITPACGVGEADVVVCRHLNLDVVTSREAEDLFRAAASAVRSNGLMLVLGHTPILLRSAWMETQGLTMLQRCAFTRDKHAILQLYVMRKLNSDSTGR